MNESLIGIDVGTTGLKVSLISTSGEKLGYSYRENRLQYTNEGCVVINPNVWWENLLSCLQEIAAQYPMSGVGGIGISCANALILADEDKRPLFPAIMQLDERGESMVPKITKEVGVKRIFEITGNRIASGFFWGPTLKWLAENERKSFLKVHYVFNPASYLVMKLTGTYCMDHTRATTTMLYDIFKGRWDEILCRYFEIPFENMPQLLGSHEIAGKTKAVASFALPAGIPVAPGIMDSISAQVGLAPGRTENALIMGSVGRFCVFTQKIDARFMNCVTYDRSKKVSVTPVSSCGIALQWVRNILFANSPLQENVYEHMNEIAEQVPLGSDGLLFFPYLKGCTCPKWNKNIRGSFLGLGIQHHPGHFVRAVMEGVGFSLGENLRILEQQNGANVDKLYLGGGGARNKVWAQIMSDILGKELIIPIELETETIGAAILAGIGVGIIDKANNLEEKWNIPLHHILPDQKRHEHYKKLLDAYSDLYGTLLQQKKIIDGIGQESGQRSDD